MFALHSAQKIVQLPKVIHINTKRRSIYIWGGGNFGTTVWDVCYTVFDKI